VRVPAAAMSTLPVWPYTGSGSGQAAVHWHVLLHSAEPKVRWFLLPA